MEVELKKALELKCYKERLVRTQTNEEILCSFWFKEDGTELKNQKIEAILKGQEVNVTIMPK